MRILHIAAHLGAGAGKAVAGLAISDTKHRHTIILLCKPEKEEHIKRCLDHHVRVLICPEEDVFRQEVTAADVIVVSWWHHPAVYEALEKAEEIPTRMVLWSHVNGLHYPRLNAYFIDAFDACMFTSQATFLNEHWDAEERKAIEEKSVLVYGMGDFRAEDFGPKTHYEIGETATIGYVGSLDYAKVHPDFMKWIRKAAELDDKIRFVITGDCPPSMAADAATSGLADRVHFLGFREDIPEVLRSLDIFMYPLNPYNFATTENALLEAMAVGLPIIATDGVVEQSILENGRNGMTVSDEDAFVEGISMMISDEALRRMLGENARRTVIEKYRVRENLERFRSVAESVEGTAKKVHSFTERIGDTAFDWFLNGCGEREKKLFQNAAMSAIGSASHEECVQELAGLKQVYCGVSKGSVRQFYHYRENDGRLRKVASMIDEARERNR